MGKVTQIEREISHKINVGDYESIMPTLRMSYELDPGEDPVSARSTLNALMDKEYNKLVLEELRRVNKRREQGAPGAERVAPLMQHYKTELIKV